MALDTRGWHNCGRQIRDIEATLSHPHATRRAEARERLMDTFSTALEALPTDEWEVAMDLLTDGYLAEHLARGGDPWPDARSLPSRLAVDALPREVVPPRRALRLLQHLGLRGRLVLERFDGTPVTDADVDAVEQSIREVDETDARAERHISGVVEKVVLPLSVSPRAAGGTRRPGT